jgi:predicted AAA+ superfamily ATPase
VAGDRGTDGLIDRGLTRVVVEAMGSARAVAILGPRQAGKTTLAHVVATDHVPAEYVTLDDPLVRAAALADPVGFVSALGAATVIDEVQHAPELLLAIKQRLDRDRRRGQFLLTGSVNLRRIPSIADALPGRVDYLTLWPLTQGEIAGRRERLLERLFEGERLAISGAPVGRRPYLGRLVTGGFPEARTRPRAQLARFFSSYVDSLIDRDLGDAARLHDPGSIRLLLNVVAARSASLARYDGLGRDAGIAGVTAKAHVEVLERLFLVRVRRPWHVNLSQRQVKAPKLYCADTGLLCALIGASVERLEADAALAGPVFETFVATELERQASWAREAYGFWHYREGEREVDVVVERPSGEIVGFEVKAAASLRARDFAGLRHLRDRLGNRFVAGVVVYTGERSLPFGERLFALPLSGLWQ